MKRTIAATLALSVSAPAAGFAGGFENSLAKLTPEFRSHQACILKGLTVLRRDKALRRADRMKTSIFRPAVLDGTKLTASGGAVRAGGQWYALSFACDLSKDWMKATSFTYTLGAPIPKADWERLGLWQ
jgi:hypothetical protein